MIDYKAEQFSNILFDFNNLLTDHMNEVNYIVANGGKFEPDYEQYIKGQKVGFFELITATDDDVLVGYIVFMVCPHIRFKSTITASEDLYYVKPEYRRQGIATQLFAKMEETLKKRNVEYIFATAKSYEDRSGLLKQSGYVQRENQFVKKI